MEYPEKDLTEKIIGTAIAVHKYWDPGLIESVLISQANFNRRREAFCLLNLCASVPSVVNIHEIIRRTNIILNKEITEEEDLNRMPRV